MSTHIPFLDSKFVKLASKGVAVRVYLNADAYENHYRNQYYRMLGFDGTEEVKICTILSEIANMPGHYVVVGKLGKIVDGLHGDIFTVDLEEY